MQRHSSSFLLRFLFLLPVLSTFTQAREHGADLPKEAAIPLTEHKHFTPKRAEERFAFPEKAFEVPQPGPPLKGEKYNYGHVLGLSYLFYEAQRSGKMPSNNRVPWRGDSAMEDGKDVGLDLTGGWYDAGDHVKFNFPMAWSATVLAWGVHEYNDGYKNAGQLVYALDGLKWVADYLQKCHPDKDTYYVQVGDGNGDHGYWGSAESMSGSRPAQAVGIGRQAGSDAIGEAAAALASIALIFKEHGDTTYATSLIDTAISLYDLGTRNQGSFSISEPFYKSSNYNDELAWAAAWIYQFTNEKKYLDDAESLYGGCCTSSWSFSWDSKAPGVQLLLYKITQKEQYKNDASSFVGGAISKGTTPKGLAYWDQWGSNRYAANAAFIALVAADLGIHVDDGRAWATKQINYMLGDAFGGVNEKTGLPYKSFVGGYGDDFPRAPHHRGASCRSGTDCTCNSSPEPHILYGALVGGPGNNDDYNDDCGDYTKNEVTTDYNAGFTSALAALRHLSMKGLIPTEY